MFPTVIIGPDGALCGRLQAALEETGQIDVMRTIDHYPEGIELIRTLRAHAVEVVFVSFESI